jgi:hypothetical protein
MGGQQGIAGDFGSHLAVAQDEVRQDGAHGFARGALDTPDCEPTQSDTGIVRGARQAVPCGAAGLLEALKGDRAQEARTNSINALGWATSAT